MTERIFNFSAGPAIMPLPVLEEAGAHMLALPGVGMSVMEISHRSKTFDEIIQGAEAGLRELLGIPDGYAVLFLQGGASLQFAMVPMNFLPLDASADYIVTGSWGKKAVKEAQKFGHEDLVPRIREGLAGMLDYRTHVKDKSLHNTPNTWGIYIINLVCKWLKEKGGLAAMQRENEDKANLLYDAIDATDFYRGHADPDSRSVMNVTFRLPSEDLEKKFASEATAAGMDGLKGHRSVGGIRASIYNAFPRAGCEALVEFMKEFERKNG